MNPPLTVLSTKTGWGQTTHWSVIAKAGQATPDGAAALEELCRAYWSPIYAFVRHRGHTVEEAQDLTQGFFAGLLEHDSLLQANPARGRFRSFLLGSLKNFLAKEWRREHAGKRHGSKIIVPLDDTAERVYATELSSNLSPEKLYDRRWLLTLLEVALTRLRQQYAQAEKERLFSSLEGFLSGAVEEGDYGRLSAELGMSTRAVGTAVCRLRQRYRELVREEILRTLADPAELDEEIASLCLTFG